MALTERRTHSPLVMAGLVCGPFVSMVDSSAVNVAVPTIASDLHASLGAVGWAISAYLLGIAAFLPATAWLARQYGTRRTYAASLVAFGLTSAACAAAPDVAALVALRALQGAASAPLIPLALALIFGGGGGGQGARPPAAAGMFFFLAPALGPTIGGLITATAGWQPIFLVNVPLIAAGLLGVRRLPPEPARPHERARLDLTGLVLLAAGATLTTFGAAQVTGSGWSAPRAWGGVLLGLALLLGYVAHERGTRVPAVSLRLLADAGSRTAVGVCVLASVVLFATLFLIPVFLLQTQGRSPLAAGLVLLPQGLAMGVCSGVGDKLVRTWGLRATVTTGMAVLGLSTGLLLLTNAHTAPWLFAILLTGRGAALGLTLQPLITGMLSQTGSRATVAGVADVSTLFNVVQRVGASLGVAGIAAFYESRSVGEAFHDTVWLLVAVAAAGAVLASRLARGPRTGPEGAPSTEASAEASR